MIIYMGIITMIMIMTKMTTVMAKKDYNDALIPSLILTEDSCVFMMVTDF